MCETPPATDLAGMRALWKDVHSSELVQVAEQYLLLPGHVARRKLLEQGVIGRPTSVQVSSTHLYHAASMIRGFLGAGFGPTNVNAQDFIAPLVNPVSRDGWATDLEPHPLTTTIATIDFGDTMGLYDFTENQWRNQLRSRRIVIRGTRGEISNDDVVRLGPGETYLQSSIIRRQIGYDLDLDGYDTDQLSFDGMTIWSNPFRGARFADEEIAIATLLTGMADWVRGEGPAPYPLADACQDHLIGCAIESSAASGVTVRTKTEAWAAA
jgi:predicted dehydrogenase